MRRPDEPETVDRLADTLSALVAGVAAGLVGDAVIVAASHSEALDVLAEGAGTGLVVLQTNRADPWAAGARIARREWLLCLEAGDIPREGWIRALDRFVGTAGADTALARLRRPYAGLPAWIAARGESLFGARAPRAGDLVRRDRLIGAPTFAKRLKPHGLTARLDRT